MANKAIGVRLEPSLLARLDAHIERERERTGIVRADRGAIIKAALIAYLDEREKLIVQ